MLKNRAAISIIRAHSSFEQLLNYLVFDESSEACYRFALSLAAERYCADHAIEVDEPMIVAELNRIRSNRRLFTSQDTTQWLIERGLSDDDFARIATLNAYAQKCTQVVVADQVEKRFVLDRLSFDSAELYRIQCKTESAAKELAAQIAEGADFWALAKEYSLDQSTQSQCGYLGWVRRNKLRPEVESSVFGHEPPHLVGPLKSAGSYYLYWVEDIERAELTPQVRSEIESCIMQMWLEQFAEEGCGVK